MKSESQFLRTCIALCVLSVVAAACSRADLPAYSLTASASGLTSIQESGSISVWAAEPDERTADDILDSLQAHSRQICEDLQTPCSFPVVVEIYPDQAGFDEHVMNPEMRGFFAISGPPHRIQMVSPANPAPHKISYEDGVSVAVHEFVHLALDEIHADLPAWLDEGTAVYLGPHEPYTTVCQAAFPFDRILSFRQLKDEYNHVQAPDLFAFSAVEFIVHEYGMEKLSALLRTPDGFEKILGVSEETFEEDWRSYMQSEYQNYQVTE